MWKEKIKGDQWQQELETSATAIVELVYTIERERKAVSHATDGQPPNWYLKVTNQPGEPSSGFSKCRDGSQQENGVSL